MIHIEQEELNEKFRQTEKQLADALNTQNKYERAKTNYEEKINSLTELNQKLKDDLEDAQNEANKVDIKKKIIKFRKFKNGSRRFMGYVLKLKH